MAESFLPVNLSSGQLVAGEPGPSTFGESGTTGHALDVDQGTPTPPQATELSHWEQESYQLNVRLAAALGFPVGGIEAEGAATVLLFGTSRYRDVSFKGHSYRYGVAIRALLQIQAFKGDLKLSLPAVAAQVELGLVEASSQLLISGYRGNLSASLPHWQSFDVDSYSDFVTSVNSIQAKVFSNPDDVEPVLLSSTSAAKLRQPEDKASRFNWPLWIGI